MLFLDARQSADILVYNYISTHVTACLLRSAATADDDDEATSICRKVKCPAEKCLVLLDAIQFPSSIGFN